MVQEILKMAPRWPNEASQMAQSRPKIDPAGFESVSDGFKITRTGLEIEEKAIEKRASKRALPAARFSRPVASFCNPRRGPRWPQNGPRGLLRWLQDGPRMAPREHQTGSMFGGLGAKHSCHIPHYFPCNEEGTAQRRHSHVAPRPSR